MAGDGDGPTSVVFTPSLTVVCAGNTFCRKDGSPTPRQRGRQLLRPNFPRVKTGCLTCRRRKKKCDESRPYCTGCLRNHEVCEWPPMVSHSDKAPTASHRVLADTVVQAGNFFASCASENSNTKRDEHIVREEYPQLAPPPNIGFPGACAYTLDSGLLFSHYLDVTGPMLATVPVQKNPFVFHVVPMACTDDLLMHSLLALGGTHLACSRDFDAQIQTATWQHYSAVIRGLQSELTSLSTEDAGKTLRLLLVLIMLCHYEIISGDTKGTLFHHLRASRQLIFSLFANPSLSSRLGGDNISLGFCLELYAYILITNSLKPHGMGPGHTFQYDSFVMCLTHLGAYATSGTMFGSCHGLFELIPRVTLFATRRLSEEETGAILPSQDSHEMHSTLKNQIELWQPPETLSDDDPDHNEAAMAAEAFRSGLHIYLATALAGSLVYDPDMLTEIQTHINATICAAQAVADSRWSTILLWPLVVAGSCMTDNMQHEAFVLLLKTCRYRMKHVFTICGLLEKLWETDSPYAFGPYGLFLMEQKGFFIPML